MSRSYNKLWHILIDRNMTKTQLREAANITTNAIANLGKNRSKRSKRYVEFWIVR